MPRQVTDSDIVIVKHLDMSCDQSTILQLGEYDVDTSSRRYSGIDEIKAVRFASVELDQDRAITRRQPA